MKTRKIVFLNNSDAYKEVFMNSSIQQFAACLLVYSKMIDKAVEINGEDTFIDNNIRVYNKLVEGRIEKN